jgi:hypothetical protein
VRVCENSVRKVRKAVRYGIVVSFAFGHVALLAVKTNQLAPSEATRVRVVPAALPGPAVLQFAPESDHSVQCRIALGTGLTSGVAMVKRSTRGKPDGQIHQQTGLVTAHAIVRGLSLAVKHHQPT